MITIDTNVLLRVFINQPSSEQTNLARTLVGSVDKVFVTTGVQLEFTWVLKHSMKYSKDNIVKALSILRDNTLYQLQDAENFTKALAFYKESPADFSDYLIQVSGLQQLSSLWTFDKKLAKHPDVTLLTESNLTDFLA